MPLVTVREAMVRRKMLPKLVWKQVILQPHVISVFSSIEGYVEELVTRKWPWLVTAYEDRVLTLQNTTTGHVLPLPTDHYYEYRENTDTRPPFLVLRSQVFINSREVWLEPIINWRPSVIVGDRA